MRKVKDRGKLLCNCQIGGGKEHQRPSVKMKSVEIVIGKD